MYIIGKLTLFSVWKCFCKGQFIIVQKMMMENSSLFLTFPSPHVHISKTEWIYKSVSQVRKQVWSISSLALLHTLWLSNSSNKHFFKHWLLLSNLPDAKNTHIDKIPSLGTCNLFGRHKGMAGQIFTCRADVHLLCTSFVSFYIVCIFYTEIGLSGMKVHIRCSGQAGLASSRGWNLEKKLIPDSILRHLFNIPNQRWAMQCNKD